MMVPGALIMMLLEPVPEKGSSLIIWSILCYLVGLIYHCIIEYLWNKLYFRNNKKSIADAKKRFEEGNKENPQDYYKAYYYDLNRQVLGNIFALEAQVAFIRNVIPLMIIYFIVMISGHECECCPAYEILKNIFSSLCVPIIIFPIIIISLCLVLCSRQQKIYRLIWEGEYFLKLNDKDCCSSHE